MKGDREPWNHPRDPGRRKNMQLRGPVWNLLRALSFERRMAMVDICEEALEQYFGKLVATDWDTQGESHAG